MIAKFANVFLCQRFALYGIQNPYLPFIICHIASSYTQNLDESAQISEHTFIIQGLNYNGTLTISDHLCLTKKML